VSPSRSQSAASRSGSNASPANRKRAQKEQAAAQRQAHAHLLAPRSNGELDGQGSVRVGVADSASTISPRACSPDSQVKKAPGRALAITTATPSGLERVDRLTVNPAALAASGTKTRTGMSSRGGRLRRSSAMASACPRASASAVIARVWRARASASASPKGRTMPNQIRVTASSAAMTSSSRCSRVVRSRHQLYARVLMTP
jgi:hypothetical protein